MTVRPSSFAPSRFVFAASVVASLIAFGVFFDRDADRASRAAGAMEFLDRDLAREGWSGEVRQVAAWTIGSRDHAGLPFVVIDQARGRLFAFSAEGRLAGSTPILRNLLWDEGSAPAGRFVADKRRSARVGAIVWTNDQEVLSLRAAPPPSWKRQLVRASHHRRGVDLRSLHVAGEFYRQHLQPFRQQASVAYVLPGSLGTRRSLRAYAAAPAAASNGSRSSS